MRFSIQVSSRLLPALATCCAPAVVVAQVEFTGMGVLPGATDCYPRSVSADGLTASGYCNGPKATNHAFRWTAGSLQDLGVPTGAQYSEGGPLNTDGSIMAGLLGPGQRPSRWTQAGGFVDLGFPPGTNHLPLSISTDGSVVWGFGGSHPITPRVYQWTPATGLQYLPLPTGYAASAGGYASANGQVVVGMALSGPGSPRPAVWTNGVPALLTLPPAHPTGAAIAVSADGLVVTGTMGVDGFNGRIFRWTQAGGIQDLGGESAVGRAINADGSVIVGRTAPAGVPRAALWSSATGLVDLTAYLVSLGVNLSNWTLDDAAAVSADGRVIVGQGTHNGTQEAWIARLPAACYANCDSSTVQPALNIADFICFLNAYAAGAPYANCDNSSIQPTLNISDFTCFLNRFAAGCG